jgi:site-specific DNA recombinase
MIHPDTPGGLFAPEDRSLPVTNHRDASANQSIGSRASSRFDGQTTTPSTGASPARCALYARVSTDKQADKDLSIPAQLQLMRDHAHQQGWTIAEEFVEPGASATTAARPVLQRLLARVADDDAKIDVVLVHKLDRMARNIEDHVTIRATLKRHGVRLASVTENVDDSVSGQLIENIMASFAQFYSGNLSNEVKKGMRQKVMQGGWPHRPPRGYMLVKRPNGSGNQIEIHPKEGPLMRRAFEVYASGWHSMRSVAAMLAHEGLVSRNGGPIPQAHIRRLLESSFYAGRVRWHETEYLGTHTPLVSDALFDQVQATIRDRYRNPGAKSSIRGFPLRGVAICASCRGRMTAERHGRWGYYRCSRQSFRRALCNAKFCNVDRAHAALSRECRRIQLNRAMADAIRQAAEQLVERRIAERAANRAALADRRAVALAAEARLTDGFVAGDVSPDAYKRKLEDLQVERGRLEGEVNRVSVSSERLLTAVTRALDVAGSLGDLYETFDDERRAVLLRTVFKAVIVDSTGIVGVKLNPPFDALMRPAPLASEEDMAQALLDAA